jgi:hypothetical protein
LGQRRSSGEHLINQHDVVQSILHQEGAATNAAHSSDSNEPHAPHLTGTGGAHAGHSKLMHADGPFASEMVQPAAKRKSDVETGGGVIFDIYGEEEDDENAVHLSPLDDGLFHAVGSDAASAAGGVTAQSDSLHAGSLHESSHHLKPVDYGDSEGGLAHHGGAAKRVQLCPNCQNPREHNRPTCPTCGTHFDEGFV